MLTSYLQQLNRLLLNPPATTQLYAQADLISFINTARNHVAGEGECVRVFATLTINTAQRVYPFASINTSSVQGISSVASVRQALVSVGDGAVYLHPRPFPWFLLYRLNQVVPPTGQPADYTQYGQGTTGSLYIDPVPDGIYTLSLDTVCLPIPLVDDTTVEAIPPLWTDAVPFFAAYYAYMSAQRQADGDMMLKRYEDFMGRARRISTPGVLPFTNPQQPSPTQTNMLGMKSSGGGNG